MNIMQKDFFRLDAVAYRDFGKWYQSLHNWL